MYSDLRITIGPDGREWVMTANMIEIENKRLGPGNYPDLGPAPVTYEVTGLPFSKALAIWAAGAKSQAPAFWPRAAELYAWAAHGGTAFDDAAEELDVAVNAINAFTVAMGIAANGPGDPAKPFIGEDQSSRKTTIEWWSSVVIQLYHDGTKNESWSDSHYGWSVRLYGNHESRKSAMRDKEVEL